MARIPSLAVSAAGTTLGARESFLGNHILQYVVVVALLVSGVSMLALSGLSLNPFRLMPEEIQDVAPRSAHHLFALGLIALLVMHLAGVLHYQSRQGDTFSRMGVRWFSRRAAHDDAPRY